MYVFGVAESLIQMEKPVLNAERSKVKRQKNIVNFICRTGYAHIAELRSYTERKELVQNAEQSGLKQSNDLEIKTEKRRIVWQENRIERVIICEKKRVCAFDVESIRQVAVVYIVLFVL